jgi:hypothetical protein
MRIAIYLAIVAALAGLAWVYPFLFELPLAAAIGGAYWAFFAGKGEPPPADDGGAGSGRRRE